MLEADISSVSLEEEDDDDEEDEERREIFDFSHGPTFKYFVQICHLLYSLVPPLAVSFLIELLDLFSQLLLYLFIQR